MEQDAPTKVIAERMKDLRTKRGWSAEDLSREMRSAGIPWARMVVTKIEGGRRQSVSVAEWLTLALVLNVAPVHLLVPPDNAAEPYEITAEVTEPSWRVRGWVRGLFMLRRLPRVGDQRQFFSEVPADEFEAVQQGQCPCCGGRHTRWTETDDGRQVRIRESGG